MDFVIPDTRARPADRGAESYVKCTDALVARVVADVLKDARATDEAGRVLEVAHAAPA